MSGLKASNNYSLEFKLKAIEEVRLGHLSKMEVSKKYGIEGHSTISKWIRKLECKTSTLSKKSHHDLKLKILELEKQLEEERIRRIVAEETINVAEDEFKISIRKKFDSKQSKK